MKQPGMFRSWPQMLQTIAGWLFLGVTVALTLAFAIGQAVRIVLALRRW